MSSVDFRHIAVKGKAPRPERLFRAAVSAFCALIRPGRRDVVQLEELTLPLFAAQSRESRRFAAAVLSEAAHSSNALIRLLCDESVDIAAPLLIRSPALSDIDLISLIGRHGLPHARAIARRQNLNPAIAALIRALERKADISEGPTKEEHPMVQEEPVSLPAAAQTGVAAARMRDRLRGFMMPEQRVAAPSHAADEARAKLFARLKMTALTGNISFFQTALSDALDIEFAVAQEITAGSGYAGLLAALKMLDLSEEQSFMLTVAAFPAHFAHAEAVRLFSERYQSMQHEAAVDLVRGWQMEAATRRLLDRRRNDGAEAKAAARLTA